MRIELDIRNGGERPDDSGYFLVWMAGGANPHIAFWSVLDHHWRQGYRRVTVQAWAGPLPERKSA